MPAPFLTLSNLYLNVPYEYKDDAKKRGAKWDPEKKLWYAPTGLEPIEFVQWWAFLNPIYKDKERIKEKGAKWTPEIKKWLVPSSLDFDDFYEWWPKDLKQYVFNERFFCHGTKGESGQSTIFKAWDISEERYCAIKLYDKDVGTSDQSGEAFKREMDALLNLGHHKNILELCDWGEHEQSGRKFVATPWMDFTMDDIFEDVEGCLRQLLSDYGDLSEEEIEEVVTQAVEETALDDDWFGTYDDILEQVLDGLVYAFDNKIIHRDLKPANIFVEFSRREDNDPEIIYKLADFGVAKNLADEKTNSVTVANFYSAPWQPEPNLTNEKFFQDTRDVFAWGVMAIASTTEEIPETYEDIYTLLDGPFKEKVGENLHTYFCKIVHKEADKRPANIKILQKNIKKLNKERKKALGL